MSKKKSKPGPDRRKKTSGNVTIKDVAAELGLSITTISRGLNGYSDVGERTRKRIIEAANALGYHPNRNAQRLVRQRSHVLAWIQSDNDLKFVDPHFVEVMAGVLRAARNANYDIMVTSDTPGHQVSVYSRYVSDNSVDGFIVDLPEHNDPRIDYLLTTNKPFVVHGREGQFDRYNWVDVDNFNIFKSLTHQLLEQGHRHIGFVNGDEQFFYARQRIAGVKSALQDAGFDEDLVSVRNSQHPMGSTGHILTRQLLDDNPKITALLYSSALMAVEGMGALYQMGREAGKDIAVSTMDDQLSYLDLAPYEGKITFARSSLREAGSALVNTLISACEQPGTPQGKLIGHEILAASPVTLNGR